MAIQRLSEKLRANPERTILQPFEIGEERTKKIIERVNSLPGDFAEKLLGEVMKDFGKRHNNFKEKLFLNFKKIEHLTGNNIPENKKYLLGAYFSKEYSIEAAALFNPSIVPHPDQSRLKPGMTRIILSLRATGEGHISSIEFRTGIIDEENNIYLDPVSNQTELAEVVNGKNFSAKEIQSKRKYFDDIEEKLIKALPESFSKEEFYKTAQTLKHADGKSIAALLDYIDSNYEIKFNSGTKINERVIFPYSKSESMGMEDMRLVKFTEDDGTQKYYGTYTAYNGRSFRVQMLETTDFTNFEIKTLHGNAVKDKGMALFPRKINGKYFMVGRQDGENISIMESDDLHYWRDYKLLKQPEQSWEFVQLGNCGSPIETEKGWLLITHAVGYFRKYVISACLLDINNPDKVIASMKNPLISPDENEREGYVPNVVYSCGSLLHKNELIIPYAMSDSVTGFAKIEINELLNEMI